MDERPTKLERPESPSGPTATLRRSPQATLQLRRELLDLDVEAVEMPGRASRRRDPGRWTLAALGALVVNLAESQLLAAVVAAVRSWLAGSPRRSIKLELGGDVLELTGVSSDGAAAADRRVAGPARQPVTDRWTATRSALIVASDHYTDPGLRRLRAPASDARALAAVLQDPGIGGFEVRTLLNEPAHEVNLAVEEFFADRRPDDLLLVHFSCHGVKDEDGELYFATANTVLGRLGATAVAAEFVNRRMSRSRSRRVVLLLDCCYAGAFERGLVARAGQEMGIEQQFGGRGRAVITASSAMEYAFEAGELADTREVAPSVFTSALVEGLETGEADRDQDGLVALDELYDYVYDKVRTATPNQTPGKWTFGVQGELYIARRARPVTTPAPLPPELQQAIDSPLAAVRAAAVQELARLLRGRHAGLALAARLALEQLTDDDSRTVAAAATAALGAPAPGPPAPARPELALSATVIDLGTAPPARSVPRTSGPDLAMRAVETSTRGRPPRRAGSTSARPETSLWSPSTPARPASTRAPSPLTATAERPPSACARCRPCAATCL